MVSSTLNPKAIVKEKTITPDSFSNFMVGSSISKPSSVSEASNKIVRFSSPNVQVLPSNISNILNNISTNILNQVDNSIKNTTNFLNSDYEIKFNKLQVELNTKLLNIEGKILPVESKVNELENTLGTIQKTVIDLNKNVQEQLIVQKQEIDVLRNQIEADKNNYQNIQSENPVTTIQNVVVQIQDQVQNVLSNTLRNFTQDYRDKIKGFDDRRPNEVLNKFTVLYQNAVGFVNFFGNKSNVDVVSKNLKALRNMFEESFEVSKVLRQTIIKIVKQLSNLPTASPTSNGLNLDVNVPGGRLKQAGGPSVSNVARGRGRMGGIIGGGLGLLGLGGAAAAFSGMSKAQEYQESMLSGSKVSPAMGDQYLPEAIVDSFSQIVDRFSTAISELIGGAKSSPGGGGGGGGDTTSPDGGGPSSTSPGAMSDATVSPEVQTAGLKENFAPIAQDILESGLIDPSKLSDRAAMGAMLAVGQMETNFNYDKAYSGLGGAGNNMQGFLQLNRAYHKVSGEKEYLNYVIPKFQGKTSSFTGQTKFNPLVFAENLKNAKTGWDVANAMKAAGFTRNDFDPLDTPEESNRLTSDQVEAIKKIVFSNLNLQSQASSSPGQKMEMRASEPTPAQSSAKVSPAPSKTQSTQAKVQKISQPAQQVPQTISLSPTIIDASPSQSQQSSGAGGGVVSPPASGGGSIEVPMLPTTNPDNFLTMYSRIVYNIVDG